MIKYISDYQNVNRDNLLSLFVRLMLGYKNVEQRCPATVSMVDPCYSTSLTCTPNKSFKGDAKHCITML